MVTPSDDVDAYAGKVAAEHVAKSFSSVKTVTQDIIVKLPITYECTDAEIVGAAVLLLNGIYRYRVNKAKVIVQERNRLPGFLYSRQRPHSRPRSQDTNERTG